MIRTWPLQTALYYLNRRGYTRSDIRHRVLDMNDRQWKQWRHRLAEYQLTEDRADFIAIELLGLHPCLVWTDWCDEWQGELFDDLLDAA